MALRKTRARVLAAGCGGVGLLAALGAALGSGSATAQAIPPCGLHGTLSAKMTFIPGSNAAGTEEYRLTVTNGTAGPCVVGNHPTLRLLGRTGKPLPTHVDRVGKNGSVTIPAHGKARAKLRFSADIAGRGEPQKGPCEPKAYHVKVGFSVPGSGGKKASVRGAVKPPTPVCERGGMQEMGLQSSVRASNTY